MDLPAWFVANGGFIHSDAEIVRGDDGISIRVRDGGLIEPESVICRSPYALTLSHRNAGNSTVLSKLAESLPRHVVSYLVLLEEYAKGGGSFWAPYIRNLPRELTTPLQFSEDDKRWLKGTSLFASTEELLAVRTSECEKANALLSSYNNDAAACQLRGACSLENYLWAASVFSSRSFISDPTLSSDGKSSPVLYPVLDALNHDPLARTSWKFEDGNFGLSTIDAIPGGSEARNNYGPKGNDELLFGYGFCIAGNPHDKIAVRIVRPPPAVLEKLRRLYPSHFVSSDWKADESTFYICGKNHSSGGYEHAGLPPWLCERLRGIPPLLLRVMFEDAIFSRCEMEYFRTARFNKRVIPGILPEILFQLRRKVWLMGKSSKDLPQAPRNKKQAYAKIHRDGQWEILQETISDLKGLTDMYRSKHTGVSLLYLEDLLEMERSRDAEWHAGFCKGLEAALGSSDVKKLRVWEVEDVGLVLWFAAMLLVWGSSPCEVPSSPSQRLLRSLLEDCPVDKAPSLGVEQLEWLTGVIQIASGATEGPQWTALSDAEPQVLGWAFWIMTVEFVRENGFYYIALYDDESSDYAAVQ